MTSLDNYFVEHILAGYYERKMNYTWPRVCGKQYNGSTVTKFRARASNYRSTHYNFQKEKIMSNQVHNQKRFQKHLQNDHNGIYD